jgi:hypothetical protein
MMYSVAMFSALSAAYLLAVSQTTPQTPMGVFENLKLPRMLGLIPSTQGPAKTWTGKLEMLVPNETLALKQVGEIQVITTDLSSSNPAPKSEQILATYRGAIFGSQTLAGSHLRVTPCKFGETNMIVLDGSSVLVTPDRVSPIYMIAFAFLDGTTAYQVQAFSLQPEKYEELLKAFENITLRDVKVSGWPTSFAGTFSTGFSPFSVKAPKALFPVLGEKVDESLEGQFIGAVNVPRGSTIATFLQN